MWWLGLPLMGDEMHLDRLYSVDFKRVGHAAMQWLSTVQQKEPETLITAGALTFLALCERFKVDPRRALHVAERVMKEALVRKPEEVRAIQTFLRYELDDNGRRP